MGPGLLYRFLKVLTRRCGTTNWPAMRLAGDLWQDSVASLKGTYKWTAWNNSKKEDSSLWSWFLLSAAARVFLVRWVRCLSGHACQSHSQGWRHDRLNDARASAGRASVCLWWCMGAWPNGTHAWHWGKRFGEPHRLQGATAKKVKNREKSVE